MLGGKFTYAFHPEPNWPGIMRGKRGLKGPMLSWREIRFNNNRRRQLRAEIARLKKQVGA